MRDAASRSNRARRSLRWAAAVCALAAALVFGTEPPGREMTGPRADVIWLIDNGFHVEIALPRRALPPTLFADLPPSNWISVGWGEELFFRETATVADVDPALAARALLGWGESVVHAAALPAAPDQMFAADALERLTLDAAGLETLGRVIASAVAEPRPLAPGWSPGRSAFYRSHLRYSAVHVCNHWASDVLNAAGLPSSSLWSTLPFGLRMELRWRAEHGPEAG